MKRRHTLLLVLALTLFTGLAKADPVDPTVIINDPTLTLSTGCPANVICLFNVPFLPPTIVLQLVNGFFPASSPFAYTGPTTNTFYVVLDEVLPGETFTCSSNFLSCKPVTNIDVFDFDHDGVVFAFTGTLKHDTPLTAGVAAPEPSLMCQLLLGVLPLLFFGRKYWVTAETD